MQIIESDQSADTSASGIAAKISVLNLLAKQALQTLTQQGVITWRIENFAVLGINQNKLTKDQYNIRIRCDPYTKSQARLWGGQFKELIRSQALAALKCVEIWVVLVAAELPKYGVSPINPDLPADEFAARLAEFNQRMREQQQEIVNYLNAVGKPVTLDAFPDSKRMTQQLLDAVAPSTFKQIGVPVDPKDGKRICGARTTRCPNCTCLREQGYFIPLPLGEE